MTPLERDIASLLNKHSAESDSNTPDYILAAFLGDCLHAFNAAMWGREAFYGRGPQDANKQDHPHEPPASND